MGKILLSANGLSKKWKNWEDVTGISMSLGLVQTFEEGGPMESSAPLTVSLFQDVR